MSPSSVATTTDPRSRRPAKKRALTPTSAQAATVSALFAKPDQEIRIPLPSSAASTRPAPAPPELVTNVQGSSAGAGSGEFHVYKASRRREYERLRLMDEALRNKRLADEFAESQLLLKAADDERTRRNREKREKRKMAKMANAAKVAREDKTGKTGKAGKADDAARNPTAVVPGDAAAMDQDTNNSPPADDRPSGDVDPRQLGRQQHPTESREEVIDPSPHGATGIIIRDDDD